MIYLYNIIKCDNASKCIVIFTQMEGINDLVANGEYINVPSEICFYDGNYQEIH